MTSPDAHGELIAALNRMTEDSRRQAMSAAAATLGSEQTFDRHTSALVKVFQEVAASRNSHRSHGKLGGTKPHGRSRKRSGNTASLMITN